MIKIKPGQFHSNRGYHNWLMYKIGDRFLLKYSQYIKGHLVDLGCGEAPYKDFFLQFADSYTGVDWSNTLHNSGADVVSDLNKKIDLKNNTAGTLISLSVLEHLCEPQVFLNEACRILKPGGYMILQVPWQWAIHEAPHDYFRYTPFGLKYLFEKAGFVDVQVEAQSGFFTSRIIKMNYFTRRLVRGPVIMRALVKAFLIPFWAFGQVLAPFLDKFDRRPELETTGFYLLAKKV